MVPLKFVFYIKFPKTSSHQIFLHIPPISWTYKLECISGIKGTAHFEKGSDRILSAKAVDHLSTIHIHFSKNTRTGHSFAKYIAEFLKILSCKNDTTGNSLQRNRIIRTYNRKLKRYLKASMRTNSGYSGKNSDNIKYYLICVCTPTLENTTCSPEQTRIF